MTDDEWDTFALLLSKGFKWREPFGEAHEFTYRALLDGYEAEQISNVLRALVARGQVFGPTPGEIVSTIRSDPSQPTPEEAYQMIYGRRGVMKARAKPGGSYANEAAMLGAGEDAKLDRAFELHPLLGAFVQRFGIRRLTMLEVDDPDYGEIKRRELREAWERHCAAFEGREIARIARRSTDGLGRLDPFAALGIDPKPALESGEAV